MFLVESAARTDDFNPSHGHMILEDRFDAKRLDPTGSGSHFPMSIHPCGHSTPFAQAGRNPPSATIFQEKEHDSNRLAVAGLARLRYSTKATKTKC